MAYFNRFDVCEAHYLFLSQYHEGQASEKYARLSKLSTYFNPGPFLCVERLEDNARDIYEALVDNETGAYEVCDLGIEHPSYFQGFGTAFTPFVNCCYGIGDSYNEALDDALEQAAQMDMNPALLERIRETETINPDILVADEISFGEGELGESDEEESEEYRPYWHVGIRWEKDNA
jgi:hypothetical protein